MRTDRAWALKVLGLEEGFSPADLDKAAGEMEALWAPHIQSSNPDVHKQGQAELAKLEQARQLLTKPPADSMQSRLSPLALATFVVAAFAVGFGGMYAYRLSRKSEVNVVMPKGLLASSPNANLNPPDIRVSSERLTPKPLTPEEKRQVDEIISQLGSDEPEYAISELESMGERAIPALTTALSSTDDMVRLNASTLLNSIIAGPDDSPNTAEDMYKLRPLFRDAGTVPALKRLSEDPVDGVRENVAYTLGNIGDQSAF